MYQDKKDTILENYKQRYFLIKEKWASIENKKAFLQYRLTNTQLEIDLKLIEAVLSYGSLQEIKKSYIDLKNKFNDFEKNLENQLSIYKTDMRLDTKERTELIRNTEKKLKEFRQASQRDLEAKRLGYITNRILFYCFYDRDFRFLLNFYFFAVLSTGAKEIFYINNEINTKIENCTDNLEIVPTPFFIPDLFCEIFLETKNINNADANQVEQKRQYYFDLISHAINDTSNNVFTENMEIIKRDFLSFYKDALAYGISNPNKPKEITPQIFSIISSGMGEQEKEKMEIDRIEKEKKTTKDTSSLGKDLRATATGLKKGMLAPNIINIVGEHQTYFNSNNAISISIKDKDYFCDLSKLKINRLMDLYNYIFNKLNTKLRQNFLTKYKSKISLKQYGELVPELRKILKPQQKTLGKEKGTGIEQIVNYDFVFEATQLYNSINTGDSNIYRSKETTLNNFLFMANTSIKKEIEREGIENPLIDYSQFLAGIKYDTDTDLIYVEINIDNKLELAKSMLVDRAYITTKEKPTNTLEDFVDIELSKIIYSSMQTKVNELKKNLYEKIKAKENEGNIIEANKIKENINPTIIDFLRTTYKTFKGQFIYDKLIEYGKIDTTKSFKMQLLDIKKSLDELQNKIVYTSNIDIFIKEIEQAQGNKNKKIAGDRKQRFFDSDIKIRLKLEGRDLKKLLKIKK